MLQHFIYVGMVAIPPGSRDLRTARNDHDFHVTFHLYESSQSNSSVSRATIFRRAKA